MSSLFAKKSLADLQSEAEGQTLRRSLGVVNLTALGIGSIIGTGIFVLTGTAAAQNAGPALVLSMVFAAVACAFAALCYAELAAMIPVSGSAYTYAYATIGELVAWIIGWDLILEYALSASTIAVGWSGYFMSLMHDLGGPCPGSWGGAAGHDRDRCHRRRRGRCVQCAGGGDRPDRERAARGRDPGVGQHELGTGRREVVCAGVVRGRRRVVHPAREPDAVHSA
jgi:hypothetical protein